MALIRFYKPALYRKDMDAVLQTMVDEKIGPGERKREFLKQFASLIGKKDGIAVRSYFDAIINSLRSLSLEKDDHVLLSVLTPDIYLEAFRFLSIKPFFVDTDQNGLPDLSKCSDFSAVKAIIYYEPCCQVPQSSDEIKSLGIPVIEDITESFGSYYDSFKAGQCGDIVISALEENGIISTGGGAVALSDNPELIESLKKSIAPLSPYIDLPDMNAALGIVQLSKLSVLIERRNRFYVAYQQALMKNEDRPRLFGSSSPDFYSNGYSFSVILNKAPDEAISIARHSMVSCKRTFSHAAGIRYVDRFDLYPVAVQALSRAVSFPLYPFLSSGEAETIQRVLRHIN